MPPTANPQYMSIDPSSSFSPPLTPVIPIQPPLETLPELFTAAEQPQQAIQVKNRVFNYYFLFIALLAAALAALLWWLHRQRRRKQEQTRSRGQQALFQDVERWAIHRRNHTHAIEGLDESGEAPPPYRPKDDTVTMVEAGADGPERSVHVAMPERTLSRGNAERLPDYVATLHARSINDDTATPLSGDCAVRTDQQRVEHTNRS